MELQVKKMHLNQRQIPECLKVLPAKSKQLKAPVYSTYNMSDNG